MYKKRLLFLAIYLSSLFLAACSAIEINREAQSTQIAAEIFSTQTAEAPTFTHTPKPTLTPTSTNTPKPTLTPKPTSTPTPTPSPTISLPMLPVGWQDHVAGGFAIALPEEWNVVDVEEEGIEAIWTALEGINTDWANSMTAMLSADTIKDLVKFWAMDVEPAGSGYATLNIIPQIQPFNILIDDLCSQIPSAYQQMNIEMIKANCPIEINGLEAGQFTIRMSMGLMAVQEYQYMVVQGRNVWTLTFAVDHTMWDKYETTFTSAAETFRVGNDLQLLQSSSTVSSPQSDAATTFTMASELSVKMLDKEDAQEIAETQNVPFLARVAEEQYSAEQLYQTGATIDYTIYLSESEPLAWGMGWCSTSEELLTQNLDHIHYTFFLQEQEVYQSQFVEYEYFSENMQGYCYQCFTILTDWSPGEHLIKTIVEYDESITDGWDDYAAGTTTFNYAVVVNP